LSRFIPAALNFIFFPPVFLYRQLHGSRKEINYPQRFWRNLIQKETLSFIKTQLDREIFSGGEIEEFCTEIVAFICCGKGRNAGINQ
jgi:hypothetical protein